MRKRRAISIILANNVTIEINTISLLYEIQQPLLLCDIVYEIHLFDIFSILIVSETCQRRNCFCKYQGDGQLVIWAQINDPKKKFNHSHTEKRITRGLITYNLRTHT